MIHSKAQIVATIGPASAPYEVLKEMLKHELDVVRFNFSWSDTGTRIKQIETIRKLEKEFNRKIPIIIDLPGPRVKEETSHTYDHKATSAVTERDKDFILFGVHHKVDYIAVSFVSGKEDIIKCREIIANFSGKQKIIAKIERAIALDFLSEIIKETDAVMVARGDLGNEIPLEQIPFVQDKIIKISKQLGKPVIVATQMLLSMVENPFPTRAEVTDVANAILEGADAVMLSEETTQGLFPEQVVTMMEKIAVEAEKHMQANTHFNPL